MPTVWPETPTTSKGSQRASIWLRTSLRKSFAKYRMAPSTHSPSDWLNTPRPFVSTAGLSVSSGDSKWSMPAHGICTQRTLGHMRSAWRSRSLEASQLQPRMTVTLGAARSMASGLPATTRSIGATEALSFASSRSPGWPSTRRVSRSTKRTLSHDEESCPGPQGSSCRCRPPNRSRPAHRLGAAPGRSCMTRRRSPGTRTSRPPLRVAPAVSWACRCQTQPPGREESWQE